MAAEIAPLGFEIDTSALTGAQKAAEQTAASLDKMGVAAEKAGTKTKKAADDLKNTSDAAKGAGAAAAKTGEQLNQAAKGAENAGKGAALAQMNIKQLMEALKQAQGQAAGSGQAIQNLTGHLTTMAQTIGQGGSGALSGGLTNSIGLFSRLATTLGPVGGVVAGIAGGVTALGAAFASVVTVTSQVQDRFALLEGRLKNVYGSGTVAKQMFGALTDLANKNAVAIDQTAESFLRLARNNEAIGLTRKQMVDLTDAVQMLGRVSGASTGELASGMMQFSQALASGRLNGDELRSIMENMPALAKAIATGMGVTVGQIRAMGAEGQLTGDKITKALLGQLPQIKAEFEGLPVTTEQAFTRVGNAWDTMLATMGQKLNSSSIMRYFAGSVEGVISTINEAMRDETPQEARARILGGSRSSANFPVARYSSGEADTMLYGLMEQERFRGMLNRSANDREARDNMRAPYNAAQRIFDEVDPARKKVGEITSNMQALTSVYQRWKERPDLFSDEEVKRIERIPGYLEQLKKQLNDALPALEKFNRETINQRNDALKYGFGTDIGAEIRKLTGTTDTDGRAVSEGRATSSVIFQRTTAIEAQTGAISQQIEAEKRRAEAIGKGGAAEREAEATAKAHALQLEKFGNLVNDDVLKVVGNYRDALLKLAEAQGASAAKQALLNAQIDLAAQKAAAGAIGAGSGAMAEAERNARRAEALKNAKPEDIAALRVQYAAEDQARRNSEEAQLRQARMASDMQRRIAGGMSPAEMRQAQQEQEARQFSESFSTASQREVAYQTKLSELRAKDAASIRQQIEEKQQAAALTQKEIELTARGGLAAQVAIARERELNAIKASGLKMTEAEVEMRLKLAEQAVLDADALSKAQRTANAYVQMWENVGQAVTSNLEGQFSNLLDGQKFKMKDFLQSIMKEITMAVVRAQIIAPISNAFSDIGNGSFGRSGAGTGTAAAITTAVASKVVGALKGGAANDNGVAAVPGGGSFSTVGNFVARGANNVDARLVDILRTAAERSGMRAEAYSGYRPGDPRFHGKGLATDVRLFDEKGNLLPNYQNSASFRSYEEFAQNARMVQMEKYPELANQFRWGGYFSGPKGKYDAADLMHFDLGGGSGLGMAGGSWENGLTTAQRRLFPGAESRGIGDLLTKWTDSLKGAEDPLKKIVPAMTDVAKNAQDAAPAVGDLASSLGDLLSSVLRSVLGGLGGSLYGNGGVVSGGHHMTAYGIGGLVSRPTTFPMARGYGLMGEAGPEAILPLKRGPDGKLGVGGASGGGDSGVSVVVNDMRSGGQQVETQEGRGPDGKRLISLTIRDEVKGQMKNGVYDPEMRSQYGATRQLARR